MKIVKIKHINYEGNCTSGIYYFKTKDDIEINSTVICDTKYGVTLGKVISIYEFASELVELEDLPKLSEIKNCKLLMNY